MIVWYNGLSLALLGLWCWALYRHWQHFLPSWQGLSLGNRLRDVLGLMIPAGLTLGSIGLFWSYPKPILAVIAVGVGVIFWQTAGRQFPIFKG